MNAINFDSFRELDAGKLEGAYVFGSDACSLCRLFEIELASTYGHKTKSWTVVETILEEHMDYVRSIAGEFKACPFTAVFKGGKPIFQKNGTLYATQMAEAIEAAK
jgi:hypothetical protein